MAEDLLAVAADLRRRGEPFALATVVRCERPTSAKPGAKALIRGDGRISGWVGGACAEPVVMREALKTLRDGRPRRMRRIRPGSSAPLVTVFSGGDSEGTGADLVDGGDSAGTGSDTIDGGDA